jgi:hypothetical protein
MLIDTGASDDALAVTISRNRTASIEAIGPYRALHPNLPDQSFLSQPIID